MTRLAYYPGCSLRHSAEPSSTSSTRTILEALGFDLRWCPIGPAAEPRPAHMTDHLLAQALAARNLRQAAAVSDELVAPCPACYQREKSAALEIHDDPEFRAEVNAIMDAPYTGDVPVYNLPELLIDKVGLETIAGLVKVDLSQLKVVPYYGCLLGRPSELTGEVDNEQPMKMDQLLAAAGAEVQVVELQDRVLRGQHRGAQEDHPAGAHAQDLRAGHACGRRRHRRRLPAVPQNLDLRQPQVNGHSRHQLRHPHALPAAGHRAGPRLHRRRDDVEQASGRPAAAGAVCRRQGGRAEGRGGAQGGRESGQGEGQGAKRPPPSRGDRRPRRGGPPGRARRGRRHRDGEREAAS